MSSEEGLSAEVIPCDRVESHAKHGSAIMLMAWRTAPPRVCRKCKSGDQLEVERSMLSKIRDRHATRNRLPGGMTVGDLRWHSRCAVQLVLEGSRSTRTDPVRGHPRTGTLYWLVAPVVQAGLFTRSKTCVRLNF